MTNPQDTVPSKPLTGLKVVEIGAAMAGPFCGMTLADLGAEVVKIEPVDGGDFARGWVPFFDGKLSFYFAAANRNKKSVALDLKTGEGVEIARRMLVEADILVANYRVGALDRMGLGYEDVASLNPRLVYCNISGFGTTGPRATQAVNDLFMQAYSGGMSLTGPEDGPPCRMGISVADVGAGMYAVIGVLAAIEQRHRTGKGQRVDTSLLEGQVAMLSYHWTHFFATGVVPKRAGGSGGAGVPYSNFPTATNDVVIATFNEKQWKNFCIAISREDLGDDPRFVTMVERKTNYKLLRGMLDDILRTKPAAYWLERMEKYDVPCTPVNHIDQLVEDEQVKACDMIIDVPTRNSGTIRMAGYPIKFSGMPCQETVPPPRLGEHSEEILRRLGYTDADLQSFAERKIVGFLA